MFPRFSSTEMSNWNCCYNPYLRTNLAISHSFFSFQRDLQDDKTQNYLVYFHPHSCICSCTDWGPDDNWVPDDEQPHDNRQPGPGRQWSRQPFLLCSRPRLARLCRLPRLGDHDLDATSVWENSAIDQLEIFQPWFSFGKDETKIFQISAASYRISLYIIWTHLSHLSIATFVTK